MYFRVFSIEWKFVALLMIWGFSVCCLVSFGLTCSLDHQLCGYKVYVFRVYERTHNLVSGFCEQDGQVFILIM